MDAIFGHPSLELLMVDTAKNEDLDQKSSWAFDERDENNPHQEQMETSFEKGSLTELFTPKKNEGPIKREKDSPMNASPYGYGPRGHKRVFSTGSDSSSASEESRSYQDRCNDLELFSGPSHINMIESMRDIKADVVSPPMVDLEEITHSFSNSLTDVRDEMANKERKLSATLKAIKQFFSIGFSSTLEIENESEDNDPIQRRNSRDYTLLHGQLHSHIFHVYQGVNKFDPERGEVLFISKNLPLIVREPKVIIGFSKNNIVDHTQLKRGDSVLGVVRESITNENSLYETVFRSEGRMSTLEVWNLAKSLVEAFCYMHKRDIVFPKLHWDYLYFCEEKGGWKLNGFESAMKESLVEEQFLEIERDCAYFEAELCPPPESYHILPHNNGGVKYQKPADIWRLGILLQALVTKMKPSKNPSPKKEEIPPSYYNQAILNDEIREISLPFPKGTDECFIDLISSMLKRDPEDRISIQDVKKHPYFTKPNEEKRYLEEKKEVSFPYSISGESCIFCFDDL